MKCGDRTGVARLRRCGEACQRLQLARSDSSRQRHDSCHRGLSGLSAEHRMPTVLVLRTLSKTPYRHPPDVLCFDPHGVVLEGSIECAKDVANHMTQSSDLTDQQIRPAITSVGRKSRTSVTRVDLIEAVYTRVGLSRAESARLVELVLKEISDCLERGEVVKLSS